jgi:hypothetical protein
MGCVASDDDEHDDIIGMQIVHFIEQADGQAKFAL